VNYLRRKLKDPPPGQLIRTVRGQGYVVPSDADLALAVSPALPLLPAKPAATGLLSEMH